MISRILDDSNAWQHDEEAIFNTFANFYKGLLTSDWNNLHDEIFNAVKLRVLHNLRNGLIRPFTRDEIKIAVKNFGPEKCPRLDGIPALFYKKKKKKLEYCYR